jgi:hypothetical protein
MTECISGRDKLLRFLNDWRDRLRKVPVAQLTEEQFGQLLTLNTVIDVIEREI